MSHDSMFSSRDPLGTKGDINLYLPYRRNPHLSYDPFGLCPGAPACCPPISGWLPAALCCPDTVGDVECGSLFCAVQCTRNQLNGFTSCCNGTPCMCVCGNNFHPDSRELLTACTLAHESVHFDNAAGNCPAPNAATGEGCGSSKPPPPGGPPGGPPNDECGAMAEGYQCMISNAHMCTTPACRVDMCNRLGDLCGAPGCPPADAATCESLRDTVSNLFGCGGR